MSFVKRRLIEHFRILLGGKINNWHNPYEIYAL